MMNKPSLITRLTRLKGEAQIVLFDTTNNTCCDSSLISWKERPYSSRLQKTQQPPRCGVEAARGVARAASHTSPLRASLMLHRHQDRSDGHATGPGTGVVPGPCSSAAREVKAQTSCCDRIGVGVRPNPPLGHLQKDTSRMKSYSMIKNNYLDNYAPGENICKQTVGLQRLCQNHKIQDKNLWMIQLFLYLKRVITTKKISYWAKIT